MMDPYVYPNTNVLKNKFDIIDKDVLATVERQYTTQRIVELKEKSIHGEFDLKHLQKIHEQIFQDVYDWAGKVRNVDIAKSTLFCPIQNLDNYQKVIFDDLKKDNYLKNLDIEQFSDKAAHYLGEINMLHPFREGNGRTQREFIREIALNAGYNLEFENVSREKMVQASIQSANINNDAFRDIIRENIKELELVDKKALEEIKKAADIDKLSRNPLPKDLFNSYAKVVISESQKWTTDTNKDIAKKMLIDGISSRKIESALKTSPQPVKDPYTLVQNMKKSQDVKELFKSKELSR